MARCLGCGIILQDHDKTIDGYTPNLNNNLCQRCFRIKNYGENKANVLKINNEKVLKEINNHHVFTFFLVDFLNIYEEIINVYKKIKNAKMLIITKSDIIPKNLTKDALVKNIKNIYNIKEEILLVSSKNKDYLQQIKSKIKDQGQVIITGYTNAGKSSLINALANSDLTISKNANTTLDFIKIQTEFGIIFDSPGFVPNNFLDGTIPKNQIKPIIYQLQTKYFLMFNDFKVASSCSNNLVCYFNNEIHITKRKLQEKFSSIINIEDNTDLIIKGLGFILIKKGCQLNLDIDPNLIEIRPTIIGGYHE